MVSYTKLSVFAFVLFVTVVECAKYTSKELEELRKFYYDDLDESVDNPVASNENYGKQHRKPPASSTGSRNAESRSSSKSSKKNQSTSEEEQKPSFGPGQFIKDATKILDTGKKTIDRAAERIFSPLPLPRIRRTREEGHLTIQLMKRSAGDDEVGTGHESEMVHYEGSGASRHSELSPGHGDGSGSGHHRRGGIFKNPFKEIQNDASRVAADTGGKILSILNKFTPPSLLGLPTPLPNLEDFGG